MGLFHRHIHHDPISNIVHQYDTASPFEFDVGNHFGPRGEHHIGRFPAIIAGLIFGTISTAALCASMILIGMAYGAYQLCRYLCHPMVLGGIAAIISLYYTATLMRALLFG